MMLARQLAGQVARCNWALCERLRAFSSEAAAAVSSAGAQRVSANADGAAGPSGSGGTWLPTADWQPGAGAVAGAGAPPPPTFTPYTTKTFGNVQVPADVPLPSFITGEAREKRAPIALRDALQEVKASARAKFDETVEVAIRLGIDPRRGDQMVRGAALLPHGTGKRLRVAVFASGSAAEAAREAGADVVGSEDLIERIRADGTGAINFDKAVATPDMMPKLGKIARILGPRGLMPNPKLGTVSDDVVGALGVLRKGRVEFRADKGAVLHAGIGKVSFAPDALADNIGTLVHKLLTMRPRGLKGSGAGGYLLSAHVCSTMGHGVPVSIASLLAAAQSARQRA